jgi:allantoin racemase
MMWLPVPAPEPAHALFAGQVPDGLKREGTQLDFVFPREGARILDSYYEDVLASAFILESAGRAQDEGYDAVCIDTMTDTGIEAVRSRLEIPVVGAGETSLLLASSLGARFSIITLWDRWNPAYRKVLARHGLESRLASIRDIDTRPDLDELLTGKEDIVFNALEEAARQAIDGDGAAVIVLGSTTMYQSHQYLAERLPVPVINPALAAYLQTELLLDLNVAHSKKTFPAPEVLNDDVFAKVPSRF